MTLFFILSTAVSPGYGFNIAEEREVGERLLYSVRSSFDLIDDPDITQYITKLGKDVLDVAGIQYFDYHFFVIENKEFNAFAAPSGLIFFHSGLIKAMQSEEELVSVLAHEIGHIVKRHLASRMEKGTYSSMTSLGLALAAVAFGGAVTPVLFSGALATGQSMNLHFSREHEAEADLLAYDWMKKLHMDTGGQVQMLETMRRIARYRSDKLPQYLLTHPNPEARLDAIESLMDSENVRDETHVNPSNQFEFLRFKYRILLRTENSQTLKGYYASIKTAKNSSATEKTMAIYGLAQLYAGEKDYGRSLELIDTVIEQFPEENILYCDKAVMLFESGDLAGAEQLLRQVIAKDGELMYAVYTLAKLLAVSNRLDEAGQLFKTVSYELPEYASVYYELGQLASTQKKAGTANYYLGKFHMLEGKFDLATFSLKNALQDKSLPENMKKQAEILLARIRKLQE